MDDWKVLNPLWWRRDPLWKRWINRALWIIGWLLFIALQIALVAIAWALNGNFGSVAIRPPSAT